MSISTTNSIIPSLTAHAVSGPAGPQCILYEDSGDLILLTSTPVIYDNTFRQVRKVLRDSKYCIDITIGINGFSGVEGTDWINIIQHIGETANYRYGFRNNEYVVDCAITPTGFAGIENTDWECIHHVCDPLGDNVFRDCVDENSYIIYEKVSGIWTILEKHNENTI